VALLVLVSCDGDRVTLDVMGGPETIEAWVFINDENVGKMTKFTDDSSRFAKWIKRGKIDIEVKKEGYLPFRDTATILPDESEHYLYVTLTREDVR
jgi:hypothetical protein